MTHLSDDFSNHNETNEQCEPLWDSKLYWPMAAVNVTVTLPCPGQRFVNQTVDRTCIKFNYGEKDNIVVWTRANYSSCEDPIDDVDLYFAIAHNNTEEFGPKLSMWENQLLTASRCCYFFSFVILITALAIFILFEKLRNARTRLHMNVLAVMIMQVIMWLLHSFVFDSEFLDAYTFIEMMGKINVDLAVKMADDFRYTIDPMFTRMTGYLEYIIIICLQRYFETASLFWLLMEGWFLFELICRKPLEVKTSIRRYVIIGWGLPLIITFPWILRRFLSATNDVWWTHNDLTIYAVVISVMATFLINFYFFVKISQVLYVKMKTSVQLQQQKKVEYKTLVRSTFTLVLLFGVQNILYCAWFFIHKTLSKLKFLLIIKLCSSFQGIFVALIYCFLNDEVRKLLKKSLIG